MQIFTNGKRRFHSFVELYLIRSKYQGVKIWHQKCTSHMKQNVTCGEDNDQPCIIVY